MSADKPIAITHSVTEFFEEVVTTSLAARRVETSPATTSYLVGVLADQTKPTSHELDTFSKPLTFLLRDALDATGHERFRRLRLLGDGVLYALGFFGEHIDGRGVDRGYVVTVGRSAYDHAGAMLRLGGGREMKSGDVLRELAEKFERFADVLRDVSDGMLARSVQGTRDVVKLYERWLKTGSTTLAHELGSLGIAPTRGDGGVH